MKHKYNYFYRITNTINGHYYYGVHSTDNLNDGYMGSGKRLKMAFKKYGIGNFKKEIVRQCKSRKEACELEAAFVTEALIKDDNCYNVVLGGEQFTTEFLVPVKDKDGNRFLVHKEDPRYISGELVSVHKGYFIAKDDNGNVFMSNSKDEHIHGFNFKQVTVKDTNGNMFNVSVNDPRYLNGELLPIWKGRKHSDETKNKLRQTFKIMEHQKGEKNSQFGTCWITKNGENKKIKKEELDDFISKGWNKGRVIKNNRKFSCSVMVST